MCKKAVVLMSGGLDSTTVAAIANSQGYELHGLSFDYGQRHQAEIAACQKVANFFGITDHRLAKIDLRIFGGSALTADIDVPKDRNIDGKEIPITYVPGRNTIFLSYALSFAEVINAEAVFIGVNSMDYSGYPDCRPEFIHAFQEVANFSNKKAILGSKIKIVAPLQNMTKEDIIRAGLALGVDYSITVSCYDADGDGRACGHCDSCQLRLAGFAANNIADPAPYRK